MKKNYVITKQKLNLRVIKFSFKPKFLCALIAFFLFIVSMSVNAQSPVAVNGKLSVSGTKLVNKNGTQIQLRGMSSHGLQWYTEDYNFNSLSVLANKWGIDVFRLAMYPTDKPDGTKNAYEGNPAFWRSYVDNLVDICGQLGIYCIIDWHVLNPGDPNDATYSQAKDFWDYMSKKHAGKPQVLYEICNEPNGVSWSTVKTYANTIIPIIRANDPSSIIIVGSPTWSSDVDIAANDPVTGYSNIMYSFHFYAATHAQSYRDKITTAMSKGLAIFVTEWGSCDASGGGSSNWTETQTWMDFMATNKLSWCNWSYSDKQETASVLVNGSGASLLWDNTNAQGDKIKSYISTPADSWTSSGNWSPASGISSPLNGDYFLPNTTVTLTADAVDKNSTVTSVDFIVDGVKLGTATTSPFSVQWTPTTVKDYVVTAVAKDDAGASGTSVPFTYHVVSSINQTAYPDGTPWPVPGDIACINFDNGGEMIACHDLDAVHKGPGSGNARQSEGVDVEGTSNVGYVITGEWLEYTVKVASSGTYDFTIQAASGLPGTGKFHLESNGVPVTAITDVPSSGNWGSYQPTVVKSVPLNAGTQVIRLYIDRGNFNFSTMNFKYVGGITYTITASAGAGGTITPNGAVTVSGGSDQTFKIVASTGYKIIDVTVDGKSVGAVASYTFTSIAANHTIAASFGPAVAYTIKASAGTGGSIDPSGTVTVYEASSQTFAIVPSSGYKISDVKVDSVSKGKISSYTFTNVTANHTIEASFVALAKYTITASATKGGTITPSGDITVLEGSDQAFAIKATAGYTISDVKVDDVSQGAIATYTFTNVLANHKIAATFDTTTCNLLSLFGAPTTSPLASINTSYKYVYILGDHAAITNITKFTINWDLANNGLYEFSINTNNGVPNWYVDLRSSLTYKFNAASPSTTIKSSGSGLDGDYYVANDNGNFVLIDKSAAYAIYFSNSAAAPQGCGNILNYTITASAGTGGSITPSGAVTVAKGTSKTFNMSANANYTISDVTVDGSSVGAVATYTFSNVTANHTIAASFTAGTSFTITASAGTGGSITPSGGVSVAQGSNQSFTIAASTGYKISDVTVDNTSVGAVATYTFSNVTADHSIAASFVVDNNPCDLLTKYAVPRTSALPTLNNNSYSHSYTLGTGGPSLSNVSTFTINWDLPNKGLYQFSMNTNNGVPGWWLDLLSKISQTFASSSPACTLTGTGITGLDGSYWATVDGANFVLVEKSGAYALYFTSGTAPTGCPVKSAQEVTNVENANTDIFTMFPNPADKNASIFFSFNNQLKSAIYNITDLSGKTIMSGKFTSTVNIIALEGKLNSGIYLIKIINGKELYNQILIVK